MALSENEFDDLVRRVHGEVSEARGGWLRADAEAERPPMDHEDLHQLNRALIAKALERLARERLEAGSQPIEAADEERLVSAVQSMGGLGWALEEILADPSVENVDINGPDAVFIHRSDGSKTRLDYPIARNNEELERWVRNAAARLGLSERRFDDGRPHLILRLPDGSRLFAIMSVTGPVCLSIRIHRHPEVTVDDLVRGGMMTPPVGEFVRAVVRARFNFIITGGTNVGKTTFGRATLNECAEDERIITIEDSYELGIDRLGQRHPDVVALEAREANVEGVGEITMADLVRHALRMNPTRVCVGEVRGAEVLPMLHAMTQGNDGSMCTLHADSSEGAFERLAMYAVEAPEHLEPRHTALLVAQAVDFIIHIEKEMPDDAGLAGGDVNRGHARYVSSIREVTGVNEAGTGIRTQEVFSPGADGRAYFGGAHPLSERRLRRLARVGWTPRRPGPSAVAAEPAPGRPPAPPATRRRRAV
jgi:Flp pilus assembly CpaF family ATPase